MLYDDVLKITQSYMGIAAQDYVQRRCKVSLGLSDPIQLKHEHLQRLADGIRMTAEEYMSPARVKQFHDEIIKLGSSG
jgi:hypothetical protein